MEKERNKRVCVGGRGKCHLVLSEASFRGEEWKLPGGGASEEDVVTTNKLEKESKGDERKVEDALWCLFLF